jgi:hypothetical protein
MLALGGVAYGYFGVFEPARRAAAQKQADMERVAQEAAVAQQRMAAEAAEARAEAERQQAAANARIGDLQSAAAKAAEDAQRRAAAAAAAAAASGPGTIVRQTARPAPGKGATTSKKLSRDDNDPLAGLE